MGEIYRASRVCQSNLEQCSSAWKPDPWPEYQLIEFNVWSMTSGALALGMDSLDERFQLSRQHASIITNLLLLLNRYIDKSTCGARNAHCGSQGYQNPFSGRQARKQPEAMEARINAENTLSQIIAITACANVSVVHSSLWVKADAGAFWNNGGALEYESSLIGWFFDPQNADFWTEARRRNSLTPVQRSLIRANLKRRHRFLAAKASSKSTASQLEQPRSLRSKVQYPSPPTLKTDQKLFTCPHCYEDLPAYVAQSSAWLEHIAADLRPFMCVAEKCCVETLSSSVELYPSRELWERHMLSKHGVQAFTCQICDQRCATEADFEKHFLGIHSYECTKLSNDCDVSAPEVIEYAARAAKKVVLADSVQCPFCWDGRCESERKLEHLAHCLQEFAMEALLGATALQSRPHSKRIAAWEESNTPKTNPIIPKISFKDASVLPFPSEAPTTAHRARPSLSHLQIPPTVPRMHRSHSDPSQEAREKMKQAARQPSFDSTSSPRSIRPQRSSSNSQDSTENEELRDHNFEQLSFWKSTPQRHEMFQQGIMESERKLGYEKILLGPPSAMSSSVSLTVLSPVSRGM